MITFKKHQFPDHLFATASSLEVCVANSPVRNGRTQPAHSKPEPMDIYPVLATLRGLIGRESEKRLVGTEYGGWGSGAPLATYTAHFIHFREATSRGK